MKKLAMIGCGGIGSYHLEHFLKYDDIELAGFCDLILERAEAFAAKTGGSAFTCFETMYDKIQPDMVFICIPPTEHGQIELETIRRGIPFFVEKPVALNMELARQIRDAAKKAGIITASGFQVRYSSLVEPTKQFIQDHEIVYVSCDRVGGVPDAPWWKKRATSGGQVVEQTIHQFDMIRYVYGEPETLFTLGTKGFVTHIEGYDTEDLTTTVVKFKSGALATISSGCYANSGSACDSKLSFGARDSRVEMYLLEKLNVYGLNTNEKNKNASYVVEGDGKLDGSNAGVMIYKEEHDAGFICDRTFIDAVLSGDSSKIRSPYEDAVRSLAFTLACNESLDTGMPVNIKLD